SLARLKECQRQRRPPSCHDSLVENVRPSPRGCGVTAAYLTFNQAGEGSTPSSPISGVPGLSPRARAPGPSELLVRREDAGSARRKWGFKSPAVHLSGPRAGARGPCLSLPLRATKVGSPLAAWLAVWSLLLLAALTVSV